MADSQRQHYRPVAGHVAQRQVTTNDRGEFRIDDLMPGPYRMMVSAKGFADAGF